MGEHVPVLPVRLEKLECPFCGAFVSHIIDGRPNYQDRSYWRRRICLNPACGETFTTTETVHPLDRPVRPRNISSASG